MKNFAGKEKMIIFAGYLKKYINFKNLRQKWKITM